MKTCKKCGENKPISEFGKEPRVADGLQARCRSCKRIAANEWDRNNKDKKRESVKNWRKNNPDKYKKIIEEYRPTKRLSTKRWHDNNKDKNRGYLRARRARLKNNLVEKYSEEQVLKIYGDSCYICSDKIDLCAPRAIGKDGWQRGLHIDHLLPIAHGGSDTIENVRPTHGICNLRKGSSKIDNLS